MGLRSSEIRRKYSTDIGTTYYLLWIYGIGAPNFFCGSSVDLRRALYPTPKPIQTNKYQAYLKENEKYTSAVKPIKNVF